MSVYDLTSIGSEHSFKEVYFTNFMDIPTEDEVRETVTDWDFEVL